MKFFVALLCLVVAAEARFRDLFAEELFEDSHTGGNCKYGCNNAAHAANACIDDKCHCGKGFEGAYCTCEKLCDAPFGTCDDDEKGSCTCFDGWKGRNCNCQTHCPDSDNWRCETGNFVSDRDCICNVDNKSWYQGKKCCPHECSGDGLSCPSDDGVCHCSYTNTDIPYGSPAADYKCCPTFCTGPLCDCTTNGCVVIATGRPATTPAHCMITDPVTCTKDGDWTECSIVHWQGKCICDPANPTYCKCKCWYGWAGGSGTYQNPGWEDGSPNKALYADHCRNRCDWTADYHPGYCSSCDEVDCPECKPNGAKKCTGTS